MNPQRILIVKNRGLGDAIISLGTVQYIKELFPRAKIYYGVPSWVAPLFENLDHSADEVISIDAKSFSGLKNLWKTIKKKRIDLIYEMFQTGRLGKFFTCYSWFEDIPYFFHNHHIDGITGILNQGKFLPNIQRDLDGVYSQLATIGQQIPEYLSYQPSLRPKEKVDKDSASYIILGMVGTRPTKQWPLSYFAELMRKIVQINDNWKLMIPLSNSKMDVNIQKDIENLLGGELDQNVEFIHVSLEQLPLKLAQGKLYIGNDTGLKHICVGLGIKTWTFFGPEPPLEWHPYSRKEHPYFYLEPLECRTRVAHYCGLSECESMICLNSFTPQLVFEHIKHDLV